MPDNSVLVGWLFILSVLILALLVSAVFILYSISKSLFRIEQQGGFRDPGGAQRADQGVFRPAGPSPALMKKISTEGDFMAFLAEDAARKTLPKKEQFAAYRAWRQKKGLNWPHEQLPSEGE